MPTLPMTGGCNCGAVRFEVSAPFTMANYCHCRRCQRRTGTASSANGRLAAGAFRVVAGEDELRAWKPESGAEKWFCGKCGSALFSQLQGADEPYGVRLGALDDDPGVRPSVRQFVAYAAPWEEIPDDGLPRFAQSSRDATGAP
jgi:hypothetical protein